MVRQSIAVAIGFKAAKKVPKLACAYRLFSSAVSNGLSDLTPWRAKVWLAPSGKSVALLCASCFHKRGVSRSSRTLDAGCDGRIGALGRSARMRTAKACGPDLPTLGSSWRKMIRRRRWLKSPVHRGERADRPLTPIAQGRPDCFGGPVVTNACAFYHCTRGYGCAKHPAFPVPSFSRGTMLMHHPDVFAPREG